MKVRVSPIQQLPGWLACGTFVHRLSYYFLSSYLSNLGTQNCPPGLALLVHTCVCSIFARFEGRVCPCFLAFLKRLKTLFCHRNAIQFSSPVIGCVLGSFYWSEENLKHIFFRAASMVTEKNIFNLFFVGLPKL